MRLVRWTLIATAAFAFAMAAAGQQRGGAPVTAPGGAAQAQRGGRGGQRGFGGIPTMTLVSTAWPDGGQIPPTYTQSGPEKSPGFQWSGAPAGTQSFVLVFHDVDSPTGNGTDDVLHWLVWNIPGTSTQISPGQPDGFDLPDGGGKQISVSGSRYRGPGAPAAGPLHHYVAELYAVDTMLQVEPAPQAPSGTPNPVNPGVATRANVMQAMAGHVRGKAAYVGLFHRSQ